MKIKEFFDQIFVASLKNNSQPSSVSEEFSKSDMLDIYRAYAERYSPEEEVKENVIEGFKKDFDLPEVEFKKQKEETVHD